MKIKNILVSQPKPKSEKSPYFDIERKYKVKIQFQPFIKVEPVRAKEFRKQRINILDYTAIIFNSRHGIDHFFRLADELRITIPSNMKYFCVSETVAYYLQKYTQYRKRKMFYSETGKFAGLVEPLNKHLDEKYLFITSNIGNELSLSILESSKIKFDKAIMYQTVSCDLAKEIELNHDLVIFFSPAGITSLYDNFPNFEQGDMQIGCFGKNTAQAIEEKGLRLDMLAPTPNCHSITMALEKFIKEKNK